LNVLEAADISKSLNFIQKNESEMLFAHSILERESNCDRESFYY
jgi:hypothetical protein